MFHKGMWRIVGVFITAALLAAAPPAFSQEKAKPEKAAQEEGFFAVARLVAGTGVENLEPAGVAEKFPASTEKVYVFLEAKNIPKDMEITLVWSLGDKELGGYDLPLKQGPRWRTWGFKNLRGMKGDWKVGVKTPEGKIIKELGFKVE